MKSAFRAILGAGLALGVLASPALSQDRTHKGHKAQTKVEKSVAKTTAKAKKTYSKTRRTTARNVTYRSRVLCEDGVVVYRSVGCAAHGGVAARQGTYASYPPASDRARERASENSAVIRGRGASSVRAGAIARCNDGTYWHGPDRVNACYLHGGVAVWY